MKKIIYFLLFFALCGCSIFQPGSRRNGCPTSAIGAEKLLMLQDSSFFNTIKKKSAATKKKKSNVKEGELRTKYNKPDEKETPETRELKRERKILEQDYRDAKKQMDKDLKEARKKGT